MSVDVYSRILSVLALAALVGGLALAVPAVRRRLRAVPDIGVLAPWLAFLVALTATLGSLGYSEVFGFEPCRLCWYQRIAMYPLVVVLGVGAWRRDQAMRRYSLPLAGIGLAIAAYHYLIQVFPTLEGGTACAAGVPCTARYVDVFGFISIPFMAAAGFVAILGLVAGLAPSPEEV